MSNSYMPTREADLDNWMENFKTLIAASPASYGLVSADGAAITAAFSSWHAAYLTAVNPTTRTTAAVRAKNEQKQAVLALVRGYANSIQVDKAVSDALKIGLGLRVRDAAPTSVPPPASFPLLTITEPMRGTQDLRATDQAAPAKRGKPAGAAGLLLFRAVGAGPATDPSQAAFLGFVTRTEHQALFDPADNGKTATYFARWTNAKGQVGPWGPPVSMPIAA